MHDMNAFRPASRGSASGGNNLQGTNRLLLPLPTANQPTASAASLSPQEARGRQQPSSRLGATSPSPFDTEHAVVHATLAQPGRNATPEMFPPPSLKPSDKPVTRDDWTDLSLRAGTPNLTYLHTKRLHSSGAASGKRPPSRVELRQRVMTTTPTLRVPKDTLLMDTLRSKLALQMLEAPHPSAIEALLNEDLAKIDATDNYRRLHAHRVALERYVALQEPTSQALLQRVLVCYEEVELHQFSQHFDDLAKRLKASEVVAREAITERNALRHHAESLRLEIVNLERRLNAKEELLSELATAHRINLASVNWISGGTNPTEGGGGRGSRHTGRSMAEIRSVQDRVAARHGEALRIAAREDTAANASQRETKEDAERQQQLLHDVDNLLSAGVGALHGVAPNERAGGTTAGSEGDGTQSSSNMSELYVHSQRVENVGIALSPRSAPDCTTTHLPGESPRRRPTSVVAVH